MATCGGTLFGPDQFHQSVNSKVENNYVTRSATKQEKCCVYHLNPIPKHALFNFVQSLPAKERQQPKPAPTDRMMADAIWKGMNLSSESKKSGFSNNVEEILKLLTSLRNVCKQLFQEKTKLQQEESFKMQ
jgi:hypothetical protein